MNPTKLTVETKSTTLLAFSKRSTMLLVVQRHAREVLSSISLLANILFPGWQVVA